jgi:uncharacterized membrane protein YraQ (UPF0718 family)
MNQRSWIKCTALVGYLAFIAISAMINFSPGKQIGYNFIYFWADLIRILPFAFVLIGLFEVWVDRKTVEKHLGEESGARGYLWALALSSITVGGVFVAFPVAYSLHKKGASFGVIFTYIGASAVCRIPMNLFELSFMGIKFTLIRLAVSLPLVILSSVLLGRYLKKHNYEIRNG